LSEKSVREESETFLSVFFKSVGVQKVHYFEKTCSVAEATERISSQLTTRRAPTKTVMELLDQVMDQHLTMEISRGGKTFGICFKVEQSRLLSGDWELYLRPGPLPVLELTTFYGHDSQSQTWAETFIGSGIAHVISIDSKYLIGRGWFYGTGDNRYLLWKWEQLLYVSKKVAYDNSNEDAVRAGLDLRQLCHEVWNKRKDDLGPLEALKLWPWRQKYLIRTFDRATIDEIGVEKLNAILKAMGTTVDQWLKAGG